MLGMQDVVEYGTARVAQIPGINVAAKTGTAEVYRSEYGRRIKLKDNSMFVSFAPRENPQIVIAVVVENAGFGATWAGPIAALMTEKFLNDTLRPERVKEVERIAAANLMPSWLGREQFKADSVRAEAWFKMTKDSIYIKKFRSGQQPKKDTSAPKTKVITTKIAAIEPKRLIISKKQITT
jgi:penicillin-binding protein 2